MVERDRPTQQAIETLIELSKESLDIIAWALSEQLDRLAKVRRVFRFMSDRMVTNTGLQQIESHTGAHTLEVLQSQLFVLKVLCVCMAARWTNPEPQPNFAAASAATSMGGDMSPESPIPPRMGGSRRPAPFNHTAATWQEPPPLDDSCAKYILSVMILFMRQTGVPEPPLMVQMRSTDMAFRDGQDPEYVPPTPVVSPPQHTPSVSSASSVSSGPPTPTASNGSTPTLNTDQDKSSRPGSSVRPARVSIAATTPIEAANTTYERTHVSLAGMNGTVNVMISKFVSRVIFNISASNWNVVYERLLAKIAQLGNTEVVGDFIDLELMAHSVLDRNRLVLLLVCRLISIFL